ncbi:MAG: hypothetical protein ACOC2Z_08780 [Coleofasciculus sp.]
MLSHIVFGFFFSLTTVCLVRGLWVYVQGWIGKISTARVAMPTPMTVGEI